MIDTEYLKHFEERLQQNLLHLCTTDGVLDGTLLATEDLDKRWHDLAPEYVADAVEQIRDYPTVDWEACMQATYKSYYGEQGFDDMDEHIVHDLLGLPLDGVEAKHLESVIRRCAQYAVDAIRHEQIEPQSPRAFHVFARACRTMFRIGAAIELKRLGYKFEKVQIRQVPGGLPA